MRDQAAQKRGIIIVVVLFVAILAFAFYRAGIPSFISSALSSTQPYSSSETTITAQVDSDSSLLITEQRQFSFSKKTTCLRWKHDELTSSSKISMRGLRVSKLDSDGNAVESVELTEVPFQEEWRETDGFDGVGPGYPCYAIDNRYLTVYTFFEAEDEDVVFTLDYTVTDGLQVWRDVAELNWTFLSSNWAMDSDNLTMSLILPVAVNATVTPGSNVNIWTHGPQNGEIEVSESGLVTYKTSKATSGQWASIHVTFPSGWITNLPDTKQAKQYSTELHSSSSIASEKDWVDSSNAGQVRGNQFDILVLGVCLLVLIFAVAVFLVRGRDRKPQERDLSEARAAVLVEHPALIGRLMRWNRQDERDLAASIVRLSERGAISVEELDGDARDYRLVKLDAPTDNEIDAATVEALFEGLAGGAETVTLSEISATVVENGERYCEAVGAWNHRLSHLVEERALFDKKSFTWQVRLFVVAALVLLVGVVAKFAAGSDVMLAASLPVACVTALLANYMPRRTQTGQDLAFCACAVADESDDEELAVVALLLSEPNRPGTQPSFQRALFEALAASLAGTSR